MCVYFKLGSNTTVISQFSPPCSHQTMFRQRTLLWGWELRVRRQSWRRRDRGCRHSSSRTYNWSWTETESRATCLVMYIRYMYVYSYCVRTVLRMCVYTAQCVLVMLEYTCTPSFVWGFSNVLYCTCFTVRNSTMFMCVVCALHLTLCVLCGVWCAQGGRAGFYPGRGWATQEERAGRGSPLLSSWTSLLWPGHVSLNPAPVV